MRQRNASRSPCLWAKERRRSSLKAIIYRRQGDASVHELVEKPIPALGDGEVRMRLRVSGVTPTDWKSRSGGFAVALAEPTVPNHDGAGIVDAMGPRVRHVTVTAR